MKVFENVFVTDKFIGIHIVAADNAYAAHRVIINNKDFLKEYGEKNLKSFVKRSNWKPIPNLEADVKEPKLMSGITYDNRAIINYLNH